MTCYAHKSEICGSGFASETLVAKAHEQMLLAEKMEEVMKVQMQAVTRRFDDTEEVCNNQRARTEPK